MKDIDTELLLHITRWQRANMHNYKTLKPNGNPHSVIKSIPTVTFQNLNKACDEGSSLECMLAFILN